MPYGVYRLAVIPANDLTAMIALMMTYVFLLAMSMYCYAKARSILEYNIIQSLDRRYILRDFDEWHMEARNHVAYAPIMGFVWSNIFSPTVIKDLDKFGVQMKKRKCFEYKVEQRGVSSLELHDLWGMVEELESVELRAIERLLDRTKEYFIERASEIHDEIQEDESMLKIHLASVAALRASADTPLNKSFIRELDILINNSRTRIHHKRDALLDTIVRLKQVTYLFRYKENIPNGIKLLRRTIGSVTW